METEIKLLFKSPEALTAIIDTEWFKDYCLDSVPRESDRLVNTYFDTPDRKLNSQNAMIRVRMYENEDEDVRFEHTVKYGGGVVNGLHQRYEWNVPSEDKKFSYKEFVDSIQDNDDPVELLQKALEGVDEEDLIPLCTVEFTRKVYTFGFGDSIMDACFDIGQMKSGDNTEDICELELELTSGDVVDLKEMAEYIIEQTGCVTFDESKYQRALRLHDSGNENS